MGDRSSQPRAARRSPGRMAPGAPAVVGSLGALFLVLVSAAALPAQDVPEDADALADGRAADGDARLFLDAGAGLFTPLADLAPSTTTGPDDTPVPAPVLSVGISLRAHVAYFFSPRFGIGVNGTWSTADVDLQRSLGEGGPSGEERRLGTSDHVTGTGELVFRPLGSARSTTLDPYLAVGGGVRRLTFSDDELGDGTDPVVTVAGGVRTSIAGPFFWSLEARGFFSSADPTALGSRQQNDVLVTVGLGAGL